MRTDDILAALPKKSRCCMSRRKWVPVTERLPEVE